jgi:hypothetical protein
MGLNSQPSHVLWLHDSPGNGEIDYAHITYRGIVNDFLRDRRKSARILFLRLGLRLAGDGVSIIGGPHPTRPAARAFNSYVANSHHRSITTEM